ncbi:MAG TPA: hypothetical protein PLU71_05040 [Candidatus Dependentiae bacterium]|nr:hypothetical protein [Candidatus Dependentiae bacterium]HRQ63201.1 hypothetical protein [Candidatus Dependentiae bacterium]
MFKRFLLIINMLLLVPTIIYPTMTQEMLCEICKSSKKIDSSFKDINSLSQKNQIAKCIKAIDELITLTKSELKENKLRDKFMSFLWAIKGDGHCTLKNYTQALSDCDTALIIDKDNGVAYYTKARIYSVLGDEKMSAIFLKTATEKGFLLSNDNANFDNNSSIIPWRRIAIAIITAIVVTATLQPQLEHQRKMEVHQRKMDTLRAELEEQCVRDCLALGRGGFFPDVLRY